MSTHPRETSCLTGHGDQVRWFLEGHAQGRLPHGILLQGPQGVGKATFAYHAARALLNQEGGAPSFNTDPASSLFKRVAARSHADLWVMERRPDAQGKTPRDLSITASRELKTFFMKTSLEGGWRVAILDSVDALTPQGAQALLKVLEEPPQRCLILLIYHGTGPLLPTIRSRCQTLTFNALSAQDTLAVIHQENAAPDPTTLEDLTLILGGQPGRILAFLEGGSAALYQDFRALIDQATRLKKIPFQPFLETHFPARSDKTPLAFEVFSAFLTDWVRFWLMASVQHPHARERAEQIFFASRPCLFWTQLWSELTASFQEAQRLSFDTRHVLILALERLFHGV